MANKRKNDGIYFSRITIDQLLFFMRRVAFSGELVEFIETHRHRLNHMLYDVGFDYTMRNGQIEVLKAGYYGIF